jgi:hypothetical protein
MCHSALPAVAAVGPDYGAGVVDLLNSAQPGLGPAGGGEPKGAVDQGSAGGSGAARVMKAPRVRWAFGTDCSRVNVIGVPGVAAESARNRQPFP